MDLPSVDGLLGPVLADLEALVSPEPEEIGETNRKISEEDCEVPAPPPSNASNKGTMETEDSAPPASRPERPFKPRMTAKPGCQVFVKNLDKATGEPELRDLFARHGTVLDVEMATEEGASVAKGYAIVLMSSAKEAKQCVKALNFTKPWGRALIVERDETGSPSPSPSKEKVGSTAAKAAEEPRKPSRERSKSRSASNESGWSRYTVEGKRGSRPRGRRKSPRKKHHDKKRSKAKTRGRASSKSRSSSGSSRGKKSKRSGKSDSRSSPSERSGDSRSRRHRHREKQRDKEAAGWPGAFMPPAGMPPMMPPPWAMAPWGPMPPICLDRNGFPSYDAEEAERQLRKAEKAAKKEEQRRRKEEDEREKQKVWEDHPARVAQKHSKSRSADGSRPRKAEAEKRRKRSRASRSPSSRKHRGRRRSSDHQDADNHGGSAAVPLGWPPSYLGYGGSFPIATPKRPKSETKAPKEPEAEDKDDSGDSDVDLTKVQEEINFADI